MQDALPAVNCFSSHTREKDLVEPSPREVDSDEEILDAMATDAIAMHFWNNLEDTPLDDRRNPVDCAQVHCIINDFTLFSRTPDEPGLNEAILDIIQLIEEGQVHDPEACISAIENAAQLLEPRDICNIAEPEPCVSVCSIPVQNDGLPSEETIAFLFDHVTNEEVTLRARQEPAFKRLAALRERVLARLNS